jgi:hypothetical protein
MAILDSWFNDVSTKVDRARTKATGRDRPGWPLAIAIGGIGASVGAAVAFLFDPQRGKSRRAQLVDRSGALVRRTVRLFQRGGRMVSSQTAGKLQALTVGTRDREAPNDPTLAERVETELFRNPKVPKGAININAEEGTIVLRGQVPDEAMRRRLEREAGKVPGVEDVRNLLHVATA